MLDFLKKKAGFSDLGLDCECHCHLLPGVDDGSSCFEDSLAMLQEMVAMGYRSVTLTPHINPEVYPSNDETLMRSRFAEFREALPASVTSALGISLGAEYMVTPGFEDRDPAQLLQFRPGKVLIEMSYLYPSKNIEQAVFNLQMAGLKPVIAHPERYLYHARNLKAFERLHDMGADFQLNALSLSGAYGRDSMLILEHLLSRGWYTLIGTDTHRLEHLHRLQSMKFDPKLLVGCRKIVSSSR